MVRPHDIWRYWPARLLRWVDLRRPMLIDIAVLAAIAVALFLLMLDLGSLQAFDRLIAESGLGSGAKIVFLMMLVAGASLLFGLRRALDLERALRRRQDIEEQAAQFTLHDPLTGLPNRRHLTMHLDHLLAEKSDELEPAAILLIDINRFKSVNDLYGQRAGDVLLQAVASRLKTELSASDMLARLGADEFALALGAIEGAQGVVRMTQRLLRSFDTPVRIGQQDVHIGASIGIAVFPDDGDNYDDLLRRAGMALARAKQAGRNRFSFFEADMDRQMHLRASLENDLRKAIKAGQIMPFYQPVIELATGKLTGFEVLARWCDPERKEIPPDIFIAVAEEARLVTELTTSVLRQACHDAGDWPHHLDLALNISPSQLTDMWLPQRILMILAECHFPAYRLEIELTETALTQDLETARNILAMLKSHGIRLALDDFGTGYSSLTHLRSLPFNKIKIDRSLVSSEHQTEEDRNIVLAIIAMGHNLDLKITAEGIEQPELAEFLFEAGCDYGQGFLYSRPVCAADAARLIDHFEAEERAGTLSWLRSG